MSKEEMMRNAGFRIIYNNENDEFEYNKCLRCVHCGRSYSSDAGHCFKFDVYVGENAICDYYKNYFETEEANAKIRALAESMASTENKKSESNEKSEGCYIATAVYGGYDQPQVLVLRKFRDEVLKKNLFGRIFIKIYYALSPKAAEKLKNHKWINGKVKCILDKFVSQLCEKYKQDRK